MISPKILVFGKGGQVSTELQKALAKYPDMIIIGREGLDGLCGDFMNPQGIYETVKAIQPQIIFNAVAYTAVDRAETEMGIAETINAISVGALARAAKEIGALVVHYSTDYVFAGTGTCPHKVDEAIAPKNVYGQTKANGEQALQLSGACFLNFRTSWVYSEHGNNFMKTMLRLAQTRDSLNVVDDQVGAPTSARMIADVSSSLALKCFERGIQPRETLHLVPDGEVSWYGFARWIMETAGEKKHLKLKAENVHPIPTEAYPVPATRPKNSRMDNQTLKQALAGLTEIADWKYYAEPILNKLLKNIDKF